MASGFSSILRLITPRSDQSRAGLQSTVTNQIPISVNKNHLQRGLVYEMLRPSCAGAAHETECFMKPLLSAVLWSVNSNPMGISQPKIKFLGFFRKQNADEASALGVPLAGIIFRSAAID